MHIDLLNMSAGEQRIVANNIAKFAGRDFSNKFKIIIPALIFRERFNE